jgi:hypothetical protein
LIFVNVFRFHIVITVPFHLQLKTAVQIGFARSEANVNRKFEKMFQEMGLQADKLNELLTLVGDLVKERASEESEAEITSYTVYSMPSSTPIAAASSSRSVSVSW